MKPRTKAAGALLVALLILVVVSGALAVSGSAAVKLGDWQGLILICLLFALTVILLILGLRAYGLRLERSFRPNNHGC